MVRGTFCFTYGEKGLPGPAYRQAGCTDLHGYFVTEAGLIFV